MSDPMNTDALRAITSNEGLWESEAALVASAADEVDRLRAVIENAPHDDGCKHVDWVDGVLQLGDCTCWKADAL